MAKTMAGTPVERDTEGTGNRPGRQIGPGKPMTITIEDVWLGDLFTGRRDILVLSRVKDPRDHPSGINALNWYRPDRTPRTHMPVDAGEGSKVVYHSPKVDVAELDIAIKIATDHAFNPVVARKWIEKAAGVAGLPAFLGTGPQGQAVVSAVGVGLKVGVDLIDKLLSGDPTTLGWQMNIDAIREENFRGGWILLTPDEVTAKVGWGYWRGDIYDEVRLDVNGADYIVDGQGKLLNIDSRQPVEESWPYALLKVDGSPDKRLKKWRQMELTAELTTRFLNAQRGPLHSDVTDAFSHFNDIQVTRRIADLDRKLGASGISEAQRKQLTKDRKNAIADLQEESLISLIDPE